MVSCGEACSISITTGQSAFALHVGGSLEELVLLIVGNKEQFEETRLSLAAGVSDGAETLQLNYKKPLEGLRLLR